MNATEAVMMFGSLIFTDHLHLNAALHYLNFKKGVLLFKNYSGLNNLSESQG